MIWIDLVDLVGWLDGWMAIWLFKSALASNIPFSMSLLFSFLFFFASEILKTKEEKDQVRSGNQISRGKAESREAKGEECNERRVGRLELS